MALKIRLARAGAKKRPFYRIVIAEATAPRDGRFIEKIGTYNPMLPKDSETRVTLDMDRTKYWLSVGALPTDRVERFLAQRGLIEAPHQKNNPLKSLPKKKAQERMKAEKEAQEALKAAQAAAEAAPEPELSSETLEEVSPPSEAPSEPALDQEETPAGSSEPTEAAEEPSSPKEDTPSAEDVKEPESSPTEEEPPQTTASDETSGS